jgi:exportin-1
LASQQKNQKTDIHHKVCESILKLVDAFVLSQEQLDSDSFVFNLVQVVMIDYTSSSMKEPHVLSLLTSLLEKLPEPIWPDLLKGIIDAAFVTTLPLIASNFVDYPDIRLAFYRLLQALNEHCFLELYQSSELFQLNINSIMWGTKHTTQNIAQLALQTCFDMIQYAAQMEDEDVSSQFFETYYVRILTDMLEILVDPDCRNGFPYQSQVLAKLLELVQEGDIYTRLFNPEQVSNPLMSNVEFIQQYVLDLLCTAFPLLQK